MYECMYVCKACMYVCMHVCMHVTYIYPELGIVQLRTFLVYKKLNFLGAQIVALFSNFVCTSS